MMVKRRFSYSRNFKNTSTIHIGTSDKVICTDPVVRMCEPLLDGNDGNQGSKAVDGKALTSRQRKVFA
jgi:hypothetical protein